MEMNCCLMVFLNFNDGKGLTIYTTWTKTSNVPEDSWVMEFKTHHQTESSLNEPERKHHQTSGLIATYNTQYRIVFILLGYSEVSQTGRTILIAFRLINIRYFLMMPRTSAWVIIERPWFRIALFEK